MKADGSAIDSENKEGFEHVIRYNDGITADFILASCSVPVNYDYTRLNVENHTLDLLNQGQDAEVEVNNRPSSDVSNSLRFFWDGGLLANTP
jgi:NTE family protein